MIIILVYESHVHFVIFKGFITNNVNKYNEYLMDLKIEEYETWTGFSKY